MNALEKTSPKKEILSPNNALLDLDFFTKKPVDVPKASPVAHSSSSVTPNDDVMVDISSDEISPNTHNNNLSIKPDSPLETILDLGLPLQNDKEKTLENQENLRLDQKEKVKSTEVKPLTDINLTLQSVQPSKIPPLKAFEEEDGLSVVLHFCKDKPRPDVSVIVISTTSKSSFPIEDYKFQAVVPKVRFLLLVCFIFFRFLPLPFNYRKKTNVCFSF